MQAGERQLKYDEHEDDAGGGEESLKGNAQRAFEEEDTDRDRGCDACEGADPGLQTLGGKLDGAQNEGEFRSFADDHQKHEDKDAPTGGLARPNRIGFDLLLDFFFQVARNAIHPYDHRNDEGGGGQ